MIRVVQVARLPTDNRLPSTENIPMYEHFEHTADLGMRVAAGDLNSLFAEAARGLFAMIVDNPATIRPLEERTIEVSGKERDYLLFDWLNELLFRFETEEILFSEFDVDVTETGLKAVVKGEPVDRDRHELDHEVKAITYHQLEVEPTDTGWRAELIVDI